MKNKLIEFLKQLPPMQSDKDFEAQADEILALLGVVERSELLRDYFTWHDEKGYISHKPSDIDEFLSEK